MFNYYEVYKWTTKEIVIIGFLCLAVGFIIGFDVGLESVVKIPQEIQYLHG